MFELADGFDLAFKPGDRFFVRSPGVGDDLDGNRPAQLHVSCFEDDAHPALADPFEQFILAERFSQVAVENIFGLLQSDFVIGIALGGGCLRDFGGASR